MTTEASFCRSIGADHPSLAGHFPGNPVVPGVVILDAVRQALAQYRGHCRIQRIIGVKFLAVLRPEQPFEIRFSLKTGNRVSFQCLRDEQTLVTGQLQVVSEQDSADARL